MYTKEQFIILAMLVGLLSTPMTFATEISRGAVLSFSCAACHGTDGKSPGEIPSISGKSAELIEKRMKEFRSGERKSTMMGRHAKGYTDRDIRHIAKYFASLK